MTTRGLKNLENLHINKINRRIDEIGNRFIHWQARDVEDVAIAETNDHLRPADGAKLSFRKAERGQRWGEEAWGTAWFRVRIQVPDAFEGETVVLRFHPGGESIIFRDGKAMQGLSWSRKEYIVLEKARGGETVELLIESAAKATFEAFGPHEMPWPTIAVMNHEVWDTYWSLRALAEMVSPEVIQEFGYQPTMTLPETDTRRARIIHVLNKAVDVFDYGTPTCEEITAQARKVRRMLKPLYDCKAVPSAQTLACMGHAHIDVAWLWPLSETIRKCGRTFSSTLELMDRYPEYIFVQSQPHLYEFTRDHYPDLYERIKAKAKKGQWIPTGCMWVESDCNVTSGESLVRQILFGTRFFREEFDHEVVSLWLPDVFGYSAALPQLLRRSGIDYFLTQKISWSQFTKFPHHTFYWEGIDGTEVLSHFPPINTYNASLSARELACAQANYAQKDRSPIQAVPFGFGDGGGGPTREHLERRRRYEDLEGMPKTVPMTPARFFKRLETKSEDLPKWVGELYLEFHRGTYTTQAYNKKYNRMSELLLREAEMLSVFATALSGAAYAQERLNAAWKLVLLNQFHDIIPGSSIDEVYVDSDRDYATILQEAGDVRDAALDRLARSVDSRGDGEAVVVMNSLGWKRSDVAAVELKELTRGGGYFARSSSGAETAVQVGVDGKARFRAATPSIGYDVWHVHAGKPEIDSEMVQATEKRLENDRLRVDFDASGRVRRIFDKQANRDVLEPGAPGNRLLLFEDKMVTCGEAWDIDIFYNDKVLEEDGRLISVEAVEHGPVRGVVRFTREIGHSRIVQDVILAAGSARLDFATSVDWSEDEKDVMLKVAFPVNVRSDKARYEIQFGNLERPTHWNTPADFARFEVPAQRWVDLSESDYGVALLNDCKYGHDTRDNVMRLTLLRSPKSPGKTADVGKTHTFTYSLLPHEGAYTNGVVRAGYELNVPQTAIEVAASRGQAPASQSWMSVSGENIVIDTVKKAEDDPGIIVRLYEAHGARGRRTFSTALPVHQVIETDLMEREEKTLKVRDGKVQLDFTPFQIRTLKLVL